MNRSKTKDEIIENSDTQRETQKGIDPDSSINLVFYIPKPPHAGCKIFASLDDNLNVLLKFDEFVSSFERKSSSLRRKGQKISKTQAKKIDQ